MEGGRTIGRDYLNPVVLLAVWMEGVDTRRGVKCVGWGLLLWERGRREEGGEGEVVGEKEGGREGGTERDDRIISIQ